LLVALVEALQRLEESAHKDEVLERVLAGMRLLDEEEHDLIEVVPYEAVIQPGGDRAKGVADYLLN